MKTQQVNREGLIEVNEDHTLSNKEILCVLNKTLKDEIVSHNSFFSYQNKIAFLVKNITYLGNPHPIYKKRIQIPNYYYDVICENENNGLDSIITGIYSYDDSYLFVVYNHDTYLNNKLNNSSAHIYVSDLLNARVNGYFRKVDKNFNEILVFNEVKFVEYINNRINSETPLVIQAEREVTQHLVNFWNTIPKKLYGIDCYKEMVNSNFSKAYEAEWIGFYYEYLFEKYLDSNVTKLIDLYGDKNNGGIDLDLKFTFKNDFYGDLKSHQIKTGLQGNKEETINKIVDRNGKIWYLLMSFESESDEKYEYKVTDYWQKIKIDFNNKEPQQSKHKNIKHRSYSNKMKNNVTIVDFHIVEITKEVMEYIGIYNQGINSNGKMRLPKISISNKNIKELSILHIEK